VRLFAEGRAALCDHDVVTFSRGRSVEWRLRGSERPLPAAGAAAAAGAAVAHPWSAAALRVPGAALLCGEYVVPVLQAGCAGDGANRAQGRVVLGATHEHVDWRDDLDALAEVAKAEEVKHAAAQAAAEAGATPPGAGGGLLAGGDGGSGGGGASALQQRCDNWWRLCESGPLEAGPGPVADVLAVAGGKLRRAAGALWPPLLASLPTAMPAALPTAMPMPTALSEEQRFMDGPVATAAARVLGRLSHRGRLPVAGRLPRLPRLIAAARGAAHDAGAGAGDSGGGDEADARPGRLWVVSGLGSRGLVHHAILANDVARAVLADDDGLIPKEVRL